MKFGIARKIDLLMIGVIVTFGFLLGFYFIQEQKKTLNAELNVRMEALITNLSINSEYPVLVKDRIAIARLVKGMLAQKDIIYCRIEDENSQVLYQDGSIKEDRIKTFSLPIITEKSAKLSGEELVFNPAAKHSGDKEEIGQALFVISLAQFRKEFNKVGKAVIFVIITFILLAALASSLLLKFILAQPIKHLVLGTKRVARGDLNFKVSLNRNDEIGELASAFNKMTDDLQQTVVSKDYVDNIIRSMIDTLIVINSDGRIKTVNKATLDLLGYKEDELIGKPIEIIWAAGDSNQPLLEELIKKEVLSGVEKVYLSKDGRKIPMLFSGSVMSSQGEIQGIVCQALDITERKHAEEEKQRLAAQLLQAGKMAALGQLAGGIAHEINNPIAVILGFAQGLVKRIKEDDFFSMPLKSIEREASRCKKLVGDLLTFSRVGKTQAESVDLNRTIDETLSLIETKSKMQNIEIVRNYSNDLPSLTVNKNQIQQVIMNLCSNAVDALPGGGKITISTKLKDKGGVDGDLQMRDEGRLSDRNFVEIVVADNGEGMSLEVKQRIFEPFFTTKEVGKGTGLGLSLCYEIIKKHNGGIEVESEAGKGTTFLIKLPTNGVKE